MSVILKDEVEAKKYFLKAMKTENPTEVIVYHNQRDTMKKILREACAEAGRVLIEKDLTTALENEFGALKFESTPPEWMKPVFEKSAGKGFVIWLREFHEAPHSVKDDVLNLLIKRNVEGWEFPAKTLLILGLFTADAGTEAISHTHTVRFFR